MRIAFDGDAVLSGDESERIYQDEGLEAFNAHERAMEDTPMNPGPFKGLLQAIGSIQQRFPARECPIRTALVTCRRALAHLRFIKTLRSWGVTVSESFFLSGMNKAKALHTFKPHIYFDDQPVHLDDAAASIPSAHVVRFSPRG